MSGDALLIAIVFCGVGAVVTLVITWVWGLVPWIIRMFMRTFIFSIVFKEPEKFEERDAQEAKKTAEALLKRNKTYAESLSFDEALQRQRAQALHPPALEMPTDKMPIMPLPDEDEAPSFVELKDDDGDDDDRSRPSRLVERYGDD